jgi:hypothetical protein
MDSGDRRLSSVLRALRKLEQETYTSSGMPGGPGSDSGPTRYPGRTWRRYRILGTLLILTLVLSGILAISLDRTWRFSTGSPENDNDPVQTAAVDSGFSSVPPNAPAGPADTDVGPWGAVEQKERNNQTEADPGAAGVYSEIPAEPPDRVLPEDAADMVSSGSGGGVSETSAEERQTKKDMEISAMLSPTEDPEFPELAPSAGLKLQAISWSADPTRRLAVINGRLCREGENIEGFNLIRINPEDILISDGRSQTRLVFKIR